MAKLKNITTVMGALLAAGYGSAAMAEPWAAADSFLRIYDLRITEGNGGAGVGTPLNLLDPTAPKFVELLAPPATSYSMQASVNGIVQTVPSTTVTGLTATIPFTQAKASLAGPGTGAYTAYNLLVGQPTSTYAGSANETTGAAVVDGDGDGSIDNPDNIPMQSQVSLLGSNLVGGAASENRFSVSYQFQTTATMLFEISFLADATLRAQLGQPTGVTAFAAYNWTLSLQNGNGQEIFSWSPNGTLDTQSCSNSLVNSCIEYADGTGVAGEGTLNTNVSRGIPFTNNALVQFTGGNYELEVSLDANELYTLNISHTTRVNAQTAIPEPASLALLGLGLVGMGVASKRRKA